jgi:hypothetical protein
VRTDATDNFIPLRSLDWQVHVYGHVRETLDSACRELGLTHHVFAWSDAAEKAGLERDALYLVRPDGHVAFASSEQNIMNLKAFIDRFGLRFNTQVSGNS